MSGVHCQHCGKFAVSDDRIGDWWDYNSGYLCLQCTDKFLSRNSKTTRKPEDASYVELRERLVAINEKATEQEKRLIKEYPKFADTHAQPTTEREYGAFWSLDVLYWVRDYCDGFIDTDEE